MLNATARADAAKDAEYKRKAVEEYRARPAPLTVGQMDDLQAELEKLHAENAELKQKLAGQAKPNPAAAANAKPTRHTVIELGMTRDELIAFVKARPREYSIGGFETRAGGVATDTEQVISSTVASRRRGETTQVQDNISAAGEVDKTARTGSVTNDVSDRMTERRKLVAKREHVSIDMLGYKSGVVGSERNMRGSYDVHGSVKAVTGHLDVDLVDDVVTGVRSGRR
jgi:hypothetical protein